MIDHVVAEHNARYAERLYRIYVADLLKAIAESTGRVEVQYRYSDLIEKPSEEETGDATALRVIKKLGLKVGMNGN